MQPPSQEPAGAPAPGGAADPCAEDGQDVSSAGPDDESAAPCTSPSGHRARIEELYRMSSGEDAVVLLWTLRVCDQCPPDGWADRIRAQGGPSAVRVLAAFRRLGVHTGRDV